MTTPINDFGFVKVETICGECYLRVKDITSVSPKLLKVICGGFKFDLTSACMVRLMEILHLM